MSEQKRYETRPALIVMAMRLAEGEEPDVRAELAAGTSIPEDRLVKTKLK